MHAAVRIGETTVLASDGHCQGQPSFQGLSLTVSVADEAQADRVFNALADGGKVTMPMAGAFWAKRFGMLVDKFGVPWIINGEQLPIG